MLGRTIGWTPQKTLNIRRSQICCLLVILTGILPGEVAHAQEALHPLKPTDCSSPQATLQSFISNMEELFRLVKEDDAVIGDLEAEIFVDRAVRCLDLSQIDPTSADDLGARRAVLLMEILDRIEVPIDQAPDSTQLSDSEGDRWRIPNTEITIARIPEGPRTGDYVFTAETVAQVPDFHERVRALPYKRDTILEDPFKTMFIRQVFTGDDNAPLKPADTSSPRATLRSFIDNVNLSAAALRLEGTGLDAFNRRQRSRDRALSCLDLSEVPPTALAETQLSAAILLMEIFDRIEIPDYDQIPGPLQCRDEEITHWTIPDTEITISKVTEGRREGEFLFSPATIDKAKEFYERVKHLPYKNGTVIKNGYEFYMQSPGPMIPMAWVLRLPAWTRQMVGGQAFWKWIALGILMILLPGGLFLGYRFGSRKREEDDQAPFLKRIVFPISGIVLSQFTELVVKQLRIAPDVMFATSTCFTIVFALSAAWLISVVTKAIAEAIIATPRINSKSIDAQMVRIALQLVSLIALVFIILRTTDQLGIPLTPVLAGLGVGGVAVALAAQNSIENLIGGVNLFADRPVSVGDFCRFGDRTGTIEEIGIRSTRIRSQDDTLITIPNATFSKMELENYSKRRKIWYHPRLQLSKSSTPDQVRFVLVEVRKILYAHPKVDPEPARIRFVEISPSSLDLDIYAFISVTDYGEFLEIAEDLNLRIMEILAKSGVTLAVPMQRTLLERAEPPDAELIREVEGKVGQWRAQNELYLPSFPEDVVNGLQKTLPYPPSGSPQKEAQRELVAKPASLTEPIPDDEDRAESLV